MENVLLHGYWILHIHKTHAEINLMSSFSFFLNKILITCWLKSDFFDLLCCRRELLFGFAMQLLTCCGHYIHRLLSARGAVAKWHKHPVTFVKSTFAVELLFSW